MLSYQSHSKAVNTGIPKKNKQEDVPLKIFAREHQSGSPLTAYKQKGIWYYKARASNVRMNVNACALNSQFEMLLSAFEFLKEYTSASKDAITEELTKRLSTIMGEAVQLKKRISELTSQIEAIEEKCVIGDLSRPLYEKYARKYNDKINSLQEQLSKNMFSSSNLEKVIEKGSAIAQNLRQQWILADFDTKRKLQYLVFPGGIEYDKEKTEF